MHIHTTVQSEGFNSSAHTFYGIANTPDNTIHYLSEWHKSLNVWHIMCLQSVFGRVILCKKSKISIFDYCHWDSRIQMSVGCLSCWQRMSRSQVGSIQTLHWEVTVGKVLFNISNYRKHVYLEETMFPLPLNCKTHNGLLNWLNLLDYSENLIPDETTKCV